MIPGVAPRYFLLEDNSRSVSAQIKIPPKYSVSEIVGYLKGKSSLMIFEKHANLKYKYGNRHFWAEDIM